jgi:flagellar basal-body rod protein FlgB
MIQTGIFDQAHLSDLKTALAVYARRHQVVADNIANVQTSGYRSQEYRFEELLAGASRRLAGSRTHAAHLPLGSRELADTEGEIRAVATDYDNGVNNVDIDRQMTSLATNDLSYRLATRLLGMKYNLLRGAITGRSLR